MGTVQLRKQQRRSLKDKLAERIFKTDPTEFEQKDSKEKRETQSKDIKVERGIEPEEIMENIGNLVKKKDVWDVYTRVSISLFIS